jgi:hypothetical protein
MNESAAEDAEGGLEAGRLPLGAAVPTAELLGIPDALQAVRTTGAAQHLSTRLVSTSRGSVTIATSVYPLPERGALVLMEHSWEARPRERERSRGRSTGR